MWHEWLRNNESAKCGRRKALDSRCWVTILASVRLSLVELSGDIIDLPTPVSTSVTGLSSIDPLS